MRKFYLILALIFIGCLSGCANSVDIEYHTDPDLFDENFVAFSVFGKDGEEIIADLFIAYRENMSAADLSEIAGRIKNIPFVFSGFGSMRYLRGINNLFEFDHGALSGWLYSVNGEFMGISSGSYTVRPGDRIIWHYTLDLGDDLGAGLED